VEENCRAEVLQVAEAPRRVLDPLDLGVDPFRDGVCDPMLEIGEDVGQVRLEHPRHLLDGFQARADGPAIPPLEEALRRPSIDVLPEVHDGLLQRPSPGRSELAFPQGLELTPQFLRELLRVLQPQVLRLLEPLIPLRLEHPVLLPPHLVHRIVQVLHDVELVEDDLLFCVRQVVHRGLDVRFPHVLRHGFDPLPLRWCEAFVERVQALLLPHFPQVRSEISAPRSPGPVVRRGFQRSMKPLCGPRREAGGSCGEGP